jgi:hypothetical protein
MTENGMLNFIKKNFYKKVNLKGTCIAKQKEPTQKNCIYLGKYFSAERWMELKVRYALPVALVL